MSLLNGFSATGQTVSGFAGGLVEDWLTKPLPPREAPALAAPVAQPEPKIEAQPKTAWTPQDQNYTLPPGTNPYQGHQNAPALWSAERAIVGPESGGRPNAQNPVTSAGGLFQVIDSTFNNTLKKLGIPIGDTPEARQAQKYDPDLNTRVMRQINQDAAGALARASLPVTVETLQAAHRLGPGGAVAAIRAAQGDPDAPLVGNGLSQAALRGNGDISGMTVGQFLMAPYPRSKRAQGGA